MTMKIQVLVATMHQKQKDYSLLNKMNIQTDAIICNQCDRNEFEKFAWNGHTIRWLSFAERGVGLNRNNALMRADADICLFADDDVVYYNGYAKVVENFYKSHTDADVVIFNFLVKRGDEEAYELVKRARRVGRKGVTKFGTFCISVRNSAIKRKNINFHREFGGGSRYSHGEDSIFLQDCAKAGLHIYTCSKLIGYVNHGVSTWFKGYTDRFFFDKGVVYYTMVGKFARLAALYHSIKHRSLYSEKGWRNAYRQILKGIEEGKTYY